MMHTQKKIPLSAAVLAASLTLTGCAGSIGGGGGDADGGEGFEYGADQAEVDGLLADLDPVTLTFQSGAQSPDSEVAASTHMLTEYIEERSGGKMTVDVVWGTGIAAYTEVFDALGDGRLDLAFAVPVYEPDRFPVSDALNSITQYTPASPVVGEAVSAAVMEELAWGDEELLDSTFAQEGVTPLAPVLNTGDYLSTCAGENPEADDWQGLQMRISSTAHSRLATEVGSVPVSLEFAESYEGLQRGTVDCALVQAQTAGPNGLTPVAPYVYFPETQRLTGNVAGAMVAGASFETLPLAYQQILFDAEATLFEGNLINTFESLSRVVTDSREAGGSIAPFPADVEQSFIAAQEEIVGELIADGRLDEDIREQMEEMVSRWNDAAEQAGLTDDGELSDFPDWYDADSIDLRPFAEQVFSEAALPHRPQ